MNRHDIISRAHRRWEEEDRKRQKDDAADDRRMYRLAALCFLVAVSWAMSRGWFR